ncbi:EF-hand calcium-binding domain-containing protein 5-like [Diadema antillarum]|uniref:EF-hand calcium-binding domain-containing protein 5-like n=1 Tax=Diadema antillarum TaxID=105358 RepID=UPI003A87D11B
MAEVQAVSPAGSRSFAEPRPPSQSGSRSSSRVGFADNAIPHSRHGSGGRIKYAPLPRPSSNARSTPSSERPPSVRSLHEKKELNEYLSPIVKTAVRRWKRFHEQKIIERFKERREERRQRIKNIQEEKQKLARRIPIDALAVEWLNKNEMTVDARAYLLDKLLPTLIMGIEKLLMEAERRDLTEKNAADPNFNPLNFLAQYLMRNNPRYSNFPEASPYIRGLQEVTDELKQFVFSFEDNRLARVKAETRRKREEIERTENLKTREKSRRSAQIRKHYTDWLLESDGLVAQRAIQNSLTSYCDVLESLPEEFKKAADFIEELQKLEATDDQLNEESFATYLKQYIINLSPDLYDSLMQHLAQCAVAYRHAAVLEARRDILMELFGNIDHAEVGVVNRHRVLGLFENFWDNVPWTIKRHLRNPKKWPVIELTETDDSESIISEGSSIASVRSVREQEAPGDEAKNADGSKDDGGAAAAEKADGETAPADAPKEEVKQEVAEGEAAPAGEGGIVEGESAGAKEAGEGGEKGGEGQVESEEKASEETRAEGDGKAEGDGEQGGDEGKAEEQKSDGQVTKVEESATSEDNGDVQEDGETKEKVEEDKKDEPSEVVDGAVQEAGQDVTNEDDASKQEAPQEQEAAAPKEDPPQEAVEAAEAAETAPADDAKPETQAGPEDGETVVTATEAVTVETGGKEEQAESSEQTKETSEAPGGETGSQPTEPVVAAGEESKGEETAGTVVEEQQPSPPAESDNSKPATDPPAGEVGEVEDKFPELPAGSAKEGGVVHPTTANTITGRSTSVSFHEDAIKHKEEKSDDRPKTPVKTPTTRSGSRTGSAFDESALNTSQFVQLVELFLGEESPQFVVESLVKFISEGYVETEQEKFLRLQKARKEAQAAKRSQMVDQLFDKWDNDGSGYLDLEEFHSIISKFKDNMESKIMAKAKQKLEKEELDNRLTKQEFRAYIEAVCSLLPGGEDNFDPLIEFLMTSVERSYEERIRGQARKKWLASIIQSAETSAGSMQPVYKCVFNSLYKDADQHGRGKRISANIALLERNDINLTRGPTCLRYVAATPDDAGFMLNKVLFRDMKGISFASIDSGKPIHVPRVQNHGNIMFWNPERADEKWEKEDFQPSCLEEKYKKISIDDYDPARDRQGSFLVIPLKDFRKRVFGLMGIDTLNDPHDKSIFITHEISFFQGVAKAFATAYQYVDVRRKTLRIAESAVSWIHRRSPHVLEINVFMVEPDDKIDDFVLRKMITTDRKGTITVHDRPPRLERKENLFRDYLFKCVDNSETVTADAYGQRHLAFPLRDTEGRCVALVDLSIGDLKQLPGHENKEVQRMLKLLQAAHKEVSNESAGADKNIVLEAEKGSEESRIDIMFDRIMLTDLRDTVSKLNAQAFAELKSYKDPPKVIHNILVSVLALFYREKYEEGELDSWNMCKQFVGPDLIKKIEEFDPTAENIAGIVDMISSRLKDVPHGAVAKHGSLPAQNLYNWAFVCLSLLEHTSKMNKNNPPGVLAPPDTANSGEGKALEQ